MNRRRDEDAEALRRAIAESLLDDGADAFEEAAAAALAAVHGRGPRPLVTAGLVLLIHLSMCKHGEHRVS